MTSGAEKTAKDKARGIAATAGHRGFLAGSLKIGGTMRSSAILLSNCYWQGGLESLVLRLLSSLPHMQSPLRGNIGFGPEFSK